MGKMITAEELQRNAADLGNAWNELQIIAGKIADLSDKIESINNTFSGDQTRKQSIRESEKSIYRGIYDLQAEAWVMFANCYATAGLEPPDGEGKRRYEQDKTWAKKLARIAPPGATVVELDETDLKRGIKGGWL